MTTDMLERFGEKKFDIDDLVRSLDEQGPYQNVFIQEMDVMDRPASTRHCPIPIGIELVHFGVARPGSSTVEGKKKLKLIEPS